MSRAVLSLGSNLDDRLGHLQSCVDGLRDTLVAVSGVYETAPWGPVEQDDFLNAVVVVAHDTAGPRDWLARGRALEDAAGRTREVRWGPRTLDVDVVAVDDLRSANPDLTLPHPRAHERGFVLVPWLDVDPDAELPGHGRVADLVRRMDISDVRRRTDLELR